MGRTNEGFSDRSAPQNGPRTLPARVSVIGVPITATNIDDCVAFLNDNLGFARGKYICVSNVHTTVMARENPAYRDVQSNSLMSIPDGKPLSVIGRKTFPDMDRVTGPKLMRKLFQAPEKDGTRHYFSGSTQDTIDQLIEALHRDYQKITVVGYEPSVFRDLSDDEVTGLAKRIDDAKADYVWVGLGAPRQEILCSKLSGRVNAVMVGVGGAFNIFAGITPDAPEWMQKSGLEWAYRLAQEPRRLFKRYLITNTKFISYYLMDKLRKNDRG